MLTGGMLNNGNALTKTRIFNVGTNSWSTGASMGKKRLRHGCTSVIRPDGTRMGVVVGGYIQWGGWRDALGEICLQLESTCNNHQQLSCTVMGSLHRVKCPFGATQSKA